MSGRVAVHVVLLIGLVLTSCGGPPNPLKGTWIATPRYREADNSLCRVRITPQKGDKPYYAFFVLTLLNKSETELSIDWNKSRYVHDGRPQGMLVFEGIDPQAVKNQTVPEESVSPGDRLARNLMPMRLIAWSSIKEKTTNARAINPGMLPAGENGILLYLRQADGSPITIPLSVSLSLEK